METAYKSYYEKNGFKINLFIFDLPNGKTKLTDGVSFEYYCHTVKSAKRYATSYFGNVNKEWKEFKVCPVIGCNGGLKYLPTNYSDYTCEKCGEKFTMHGEKAVKHSGENIILNNQMSYGSSF